MVEVSPARILLVEDEPLNVELLQMALDRYNFLNQVDVVEDGEQALDYLIGRSGNVSTSPLPDLVLLDLKLPKINGLEVLRQIRASDRTRDLAVVILTTSEADNNLNACYALGISSHVIKPLDFETLIAVIRRVGLHWMLLPRTPLPTSSAQF